MIDLVHMARRRPRLFPIYGRRMIVVLALVVAYVVGVAVGLLAR